MTAEASLTLVGTAEPELQGLGRTTLIQYSVEIEALPKDLISEIEIDAAMITKPNGSISVSDITLPEGVTILNDPNTLVAKFDLKREETEDEDEEAGEEIIEE